MARALARYVCQQCGTAQPRWAGRCDDCGGWNALVEEAVRESAPMGLGSGKGRKLAFVGLDGVAQAMARRLSGMAEFDRVCGGGLVPGSALLVGGDPGIGKSTVLLQVVAALSAGKAGEQLRCAYLSGQGSLDPRPLPPPRLPLPPPLGHTVLYFGGERGHQFRILRAVKNRFGPTDEIGVFEMTDAGLAEVPNPSALFLAERQGDVSGAAVFAGMEGTRPVLVEIQALVAPSPLGTPRRAVVGWDGSRLAMILAVLEARCGVQIGGNHVYLNVAGGLRIAEPAADLALAAALVSALSLRPIPAETGSFGEIGLSREVRPVGPAHARPHEAGQRSV